MEYQHIPLTMNLHQVQGNQFTQYSDYSVTIGGKEYSKNILVSNKGIAELAVATIEELLLEPFKTLINDKPDLLIFGTGERIIYPQQQLLHYCAKQGIGVEVMTTKALCRTFNFLLSEDRKVTCLLFLNNTTAIK